MLVGSLISANKDFNYVINGYCKDRAGNRFIERGDYQIIRAEGSRVIGPSAFARTVEPGMVLEISIILRQATAFQKDCPRCGRVNSTVTANGGWIEWQVSLNPIHAHNSYHQL